MRKREREGETARQRQRQVRRGAEQRRPGCLDQAERERKSVCGGEKEREQAREREIERE